MSWLKEFDQRLGSIGKCRRASSQRRLSQLQGGQVRESGSRQSTVCDKWMICDLPTCLKHIKNLKGFTTTMVEIVVLFKPAVFTRTSTEKRQTLWIEWEQALVISAF